MAAKVTRLRTRRHGLCAARPRRSWTPSDRPTPVAPTPSRSSRPSTPSTSPARSGAHAPWNSRRAAVGKWLHWCARAEELLQLNIEDLDQTGRRAPVKSKGAKPRTRRRGAARHNRPPTLSCVFSISVVFSAIATGTPSRADAALADRQREQLSKSSAQVQLVAAGGAGEMDGFGPE